MSVESFLSGRFDFYSELLYSARCIWSFENEVDFDEGLDDHGLVSHEESVVDFVCSMEDLEFVGFGGSRVVFGVCGSGFVVCMGRFGDGSRKWDGRVQNSREVQIWSQLVGNGDEKKFRLAPVVDYGNDCKWVVKPRVEVLSELDLGDEDEEELVSLVFDSVRPLSEYLELFDVRSDNIGLLDGEPVLFDYGLEPESKVLE